jgi:predicted transcriptional regulator
MNTNVIKVSDKITLSDLSEGYFRKYLKSTFPVVDDDGRLVGAVTLGRALQVSQEKWGATLSAQVMIPATELAVMRPDDKADDALMKMGAKRLGKIMVCDESGRLVGIVSKTDILGVEMERQEYLKAFKK